jgi:hypothetical protein
MEELDRRRMRELLQLARPGIFIMELMPKK